MPAADVRSSGSEKAAVSVIVLPGPAKMPAVPLEVERTDVSTGSILSRRTGLIEG